jgi:hypothetical protein
MAKFLVNKMSDDGLIGETDQVESIFHNLLIIGHEYKEGFMKEVELLPLPYVVQICVCGRFVVYIEVRKDMKEGVMQFYDLKNDNDIALDAAKKINDRWYTSYYFRWFMELFEQLKPHYSDNYNAAELLLVENAGVVLN